MNRNLIKPFDQMDEIPMLNYFLESLENEEYEICAQIRDEYRRRLENHTFNKLAYIVINGCDAPKHGLLDTADGTYLILPEIR